MAPPQNPDQLRLLAKVARMYHERGIRQPQIAAELHISQSRVSRLLSQAVEEGIVRTTVTLPPGVHTGLEDELKERFGLLDCLVVDTAGSRGDVTPALGAATAVYLNDTLFARDVVGISSWSSTLLAAVEAMRPGSRLAVERVTQLIGGVGDPQVQVEATRLLHRFATITNATAIFLPTPGLVSDATVRRALLRDPAVLDVQRAWSDLTVALVGIGNVEPSPLVQRSGNGLDRDAQVELHELGAVGDVCFRFFDQAGNLVPSALNERVLGISPEALKAVPRRVGVAGGPDKHAAVRAALLGGWVNTLVTDLDTAHHLAAPDPGIENSGTADPGAVLSD
ncbi:sugar-binding transcriptional regulator [Kineococcus gynurae]|uniref:Sugar-binding transcriptional regulator n=1 Tax=Kineococcus gynurae TaxID=452979 RepID=A0ABV5LWD5_9ACTN